MMNVINVPILLESPQATLKQGNSLLRLAKLHAILSVDEETRTETEEKIKAVCQRALGNPSMAESKELLIQELNLINRKIIPLYPLKEDRDSFEQAINRLMRDIVTVITPPVRRTFQGLEGPTFLVNFTEFNPDNSIERFKGCVIKWTNWNEIGCSTIYKFFATRGLFSVPVTSAYDLEKEIFTENNGSQRSIAANEVARIDRMFIDLRNTCAPECHAEDPHVMISEKINGENIRAFTYTKFASLNETQKYALFKQLGSISLLDLIFGNDDRMVPIQLDEETGCYTLKADEANLGNAMVTWDEEDELPQVHAIDNGIDNRFLDEPQLAENYRTFLQTLLQSPTFIKDLAESMVQNIESTVEGTSNKLSQSPAAYDHIKAEKMLAFKKQLRPLALEAFQEGITEMKRVLKGHLITEWKSEKTAALKQTIQIIPEFLPELERRIDLFCRLDHS